MDMARGATGSPPRRTGRAVDDEAGGLTGDLTRYDRNSEAALRHTRIKSPAANEGSGPGHSAFCNTLLWGARVPSL
jgi:hypothetical protein